MSNSEDLFNPFDLVLAKISANKSSVFKILDEFSVYCHYIEESIGPCDIQIEDNFRSPLREDDTNPSFRLYYSQGELKFTDYGNENKTGDIVQFVAELYQITEQQALKKITSDFGLSSISSTKKAPKRRFDVKQKKTLDIKIKPFNKEELIFWNQYHISKATLERYNVFSVAMIYWDDIPITPKGLNFAYRIGAYYKIYTPFDKKHKFVSSYPQDYVEGVLQLKYEKEILIITKSTKDIMVLHEMGFEAISPKSENTLVPDYILAKITPKYKRTVIFFDNDGKESSHKYPYKSIKLPIDTAKDISDAVKAIGFNEAKNLLNKLLCY